MSIVVPCPLLKFAAKSSFFNYCQLCFDFPVTYFVSFMKYSCFTCFLFLSKYTHLLDRTHELILPMCPFMLHFTTMNNPPAISIFYVFREWSSIWFMCPGFLCNISERPRTVTHIACAKKLSGLRLLLLPRCLFLSHCQMYPHSKAAQQERVPALCHRSSQPSKAAKTSPHLRLWTRPAKIGVDMLPISLSSCGGEVAYDEQRCFEMYF